jgi:hypothetical protein
MKAFTLGAYLFGSFRACCDRLVAGHTSVRNAFWAGVVPFLLRGS